MFRTLFSMGLLQAVGIVLNAVRAKLLAVLLGPAGFGIVATIDQLVVTAVQCGNFSVPFTALKFLSRSHSLGQEEFVRAYAAFLRLILLLAAVTTAGAMAIAPFVLEHLDAELAAHRHAVFLALLGIPSTLLLMFFANVFAASQQTLRSVALTVIFAGVSLLAGGAGCVWGGIFGVYAASVPAMTLAALVAWRFLSRTWKAPAAPGSEVRSLWGELKRHGDIVQISVYTYLGVASASALLLLVRSLALAKLSAGAAGYLQACLAIALSIGACLGPAISLYLTPYVNRALPAGEKAATVAAFLPRLVLIYSLGGCVVVLFPETVLQILFSDRFIAVAAIVPWFVAWQCLYQIGNAYQQLLIGLDDVKGYCVVTVAGNLAAVTTCWVAIERYGLLGIAAGFVAGAALSIVLTVARLAGRHALPFPTAAIVWSAFAVVAFPGTAQLALAQPEFTWGGAGLRGLLGLAVVGSVCALLPEKLRRELQANIVARVRALIQ